MGYLIIILSLVFVALLWVIVSRDDPASIFTRPEKQEGNRGEYIATRIIKEVLNGEDVLLTNIEVSFENSHTELDDLIINQNGIFIIEVKNLSGDLYGDENSPKWTKYKTTSAGNKYIKELDNPIKQVKRQIYILANHLRDNGFHIWVNGYVFFLKGNSPVESEFVLKTQDDIASVLHSPGRKHLKQEEIRQLTHLLTEEQQS